jgi:hypothetical protein
LAEVPSTDGEEEIDEQAASVSDRATAEASRLA